MCFSLYFIVLLFHARCNEMNNSHCYLSDFSHLQQKVAHNEIASLTVASIFRDWHCLWWQGWHVEDGRTRLDVTIHCCHRTVNGDTRQSKTRQRWNEHHKSLQAMCQPFWLQCRLLNLISCHVAFYLVVCHASGRFIHAIRWSGKSTDGNMPEANEHQQNESSVNHIVNVQKWRWISQDLHTQADN